MESLRIDHLTEYRYRTPVTFGLHRAMLRPREGHDVHIEKLALKVEPSAQVRWLRDIYGNSVAAIKFLDPSDRLVISSSAEVSHFAVPPLQLPARRRCSPTVVTSDIFAGRTGEDA